MTLFYNIYKHVLDNSLYSQMQFTVKHWCLIYLPMEAGLYLDIFSDTADSHLCGKVVSWHFASCLLKQKHCSLVYLQSSVLQLFGSQFRQNKSSTETSLSLGRAFRLSWHCPLCTQIWAPGGGVGWRSHGFFWGFNLFPLRVCENFENGCSSCALDGCGKL